MMARFEEGRLAFIFGDRWRDTVIKFDDSTEYLNASKALEGTKGVDFLGLLGGSLFFIEVKDFRGYRIENKERISDGTLVHEVGQKVRDSVACIVGFSRTASNLDRWQRFVAPLLNERRPIRIILWLEQDKPIGRQKVSGNILGNDLKRKLKWLKCRVDVQSLNEAGTAVIDLQVESLPFERSG